MQLTIRGQGSKLAFVEALIARTLRQHGIAVSPLTGPAAAYERDLEENPEARLELLFHGECVELVTEEVPYSQPKDEQ